jgi:glycosyltransferase involved in cell wall biosynthesis
MRILLLNYEYPPFGGGAGIATQALARGLAARGARVDVVTAGDRDDRAAELHWNGGGEEGLVTVYRVRSRRTTVYQAGIGDALSYLRAALPVVRRLLREERYDVAHVFFSLPTGAMLPFLDLGDTPVVVSLRGSDVPGYARHEPALARTHRVLRPLTRWIWRRADRVVAVCGSLADQARQTLPDLRCSVIPNGVDLARFRPPLRARPRAPRLRCLAVARLLERNGLADLIRALGLLERGHYELEIVGAGSDEAALRELAAGQGLADLVTFRRPLEGAALAQRYREADVFTLVPWEAAFGDVFAQALASGLPVVGSAVGGIPELVRHGRNGLLVPPRDPIALAGAIRHVAELPALRAEMGRCNRVEAEANLSWERVTTRYMSLYNGVQRRVPARRALTEQPSNTW